MTVFLDSSALVKLYVPEAGHEQVRQLAGPAVVSHLSRVEVPAALWRKHRDGVIDAHAAAALAAEFDSDFVGTDDEDPRFGHVVVDERTLTRAARLVAVHPLRAHDAVQLASALLVRAFDVTCTRLCAFDKGLRAAAAAEGFELVPAA